MADSAPEAPAAGASSSSSSTIAVVPDTVLASTEDMARVRAEQRLLFQELIDAHKRIATLDEELATLRATNAALTARNDEHLAGEAKQSASNAAAYEVLRQENMALVAECATLRRKLEEAEGVQASALLNATFTQGDLEAAAIPRGISNFVVLKEGYMAKYSVRRTIFGNWKKRYFVLNEKGMTYHEGAGTKALGFIPVADQQTSIIRNPDARVHEKASGDGRDLVIVYVAPMGPNQPPKEFRVLLRCDSVALHDEWMDAFCTKVAPRFNALGDHQQSQQQLLASTNGTFAAPNSS